VTPFRKPEGRVRFSWLLGGLLILGCSDGAIQSGTGDLPPASSDPVAEPQSGRELIPAEWTVYEDTASSGEVTTASLQLPAAKDIEGMTNGEPPRLVLRCLEGKVAAFIDAGLPDSGTAQLDSLGEHSQAVPIRLDSAPGCE
jgi:hypothetical protein